MVTPKTGKERKALGGGGNEVRGVKQKKTKIFQILDMKFTQVAGVSCTRLN